VKSNKPNTRERFGARIKALRLKAKWSQEDLAEKAGVGRVFISQIENGHKDVCLGVIEALAGSFEKSISELTKGV
jgi:transcriptional regulator with XRE-family HTH domain